MLQKFIAHLPSLALWILLPLMVITLGISILLGLAEKLSLASAQHLFRPRMAPGFANFVQVAIKLFLSLLGIIMLIGGLLALFTGIKTA